MPTKAELEQQVESLVNELAIARGVIGEHVTTIQAMQETIAAQDIIIAQLEARYAVEQSDEIQTVIGRRCISCGYSGSGNVSYDPETEKFTCAACKHSWEMAEENSPHRKR